MEEDTITTLEGTMDVDIIGVQAYNTNNPSQSVDAEWDDELKVFKINQMYKNNNAYQLKIFYKWKDAPNSSAYWSVKPQFDRGDGNKEYIGSGNAAYNPLRQHGIEFGTHDTVFTAAVMPVPYPLTSNDITIQVSLYRTTAGSGVGKMEGFDERILRYVL